MVLGGIPATLSRNASGAVIHIPNRSVMVPTSQTKGVGPSRRSTGVRDRSLRYLVELRRLGPCLPEPRRARLSYSCRTCPQPQFWALTLAGSNEAVGSQRHGICRRTVGSG